MHHFLASSPIYRLELPIFPSSSRLLWLLWLHFQIPFVNKTPLLKFSFCLHLMHSLPSGKSWYHVPVLSFSLARLGPWPLLNAVDTLNGLGLPWVLGIPEKTSSSDIFHPMLFSHPWKHYLPHPLIHYSFIHLLENLQTFYLIADQKGPKFTCFC